jgi:hypothetical protein
MAQAVANPTIADDWWKRQRVQEQPLLIDGERDARRGWLRMRAAGTVFAVAFRPLFTSLIFG